jgi:hypothetical protein
MTPARSLSPRDKLLIVLGYTARLALFKVSHHGYAPWEWERIVRSEFEFLSDVRGLADENRIGEKA